MKSLINLGARLLLAASAGISLAAASAQQSSVAPTPSRELPPLPASLEHTRNVGFGSTPASRAAEAAVEAAKSKRLQEDTARGEELMKAGDPDGAVEAFQQILAYKPDDGLAYRRMAEAYAAAGRLPEASRAFHKVLVEGFGPGIGNGVGDTPDEWAEYALVLVKTGQPAAAIRCYNHAASLLDFEDSENHDGRPFLKVLLPEVVVGDALPDQVSYAPGHLQALADAVLAHEERGSGKGKEALAHMQEAVKLYPASAVTHYYLGEALPSWRTPEQKAEYRKAAELGDANTVAAAKERLSVIR